MFYKAESRQNLNGGRYSNAFSGEGTVELSGMSTLGDGSLSMQAVA